MNTSKQKLFLGLVAFHLALVILGAFQVPLSNEVGDYFYQMYGKITGASSGYGFFAPGVGTQLRASFEVHDTKGTITKVPLEQGRNREADLRIGNIVGWFWKDTLGGDAPESGTEKGATSKRRDIQRSMTASWAGKIFGRYPETKSVVVILEEYQMPSMDEYRKGERPYWTKYYRAKFEKKSGT